MRANRKINHSRTALYCYSLCCAACSLLLSFFLFFGICWCRWQCLNAFFCVYCWFLALCKCENLQLDLGLQGPKWIFIIYQKQQAYICLILMFLCHVFRVFSRALVLAKLHILWTWCLVFACFICIFVLFAIAVFFWLFGWLKQNIKIQPYDSGNCNCLRKTYAFVACISEYQAKKATGQPSNQLIYERTSERII